MIIDFTPLGQAQAMHRDEFDLKFLGNKVVERATEIKFNEDRQTWGIHLPDGQGGWNAEPVPHGDFSTYEEARTSEVLWLDRCRLEGVDPSSEEGMEIFFSQR